METIKDDLYKLHRQMVNFAQQMHNTTFNRSLTEDEMFAYNGILCMIHKHTEVQILQSELTALFLEKQKQQQLEETLMGGK